MIRRGALVSVALGVLLVLGYAPPSSAGASGVVLAQDHWAAIAKNDLGVTNMDYVGDAVLEWVNGPLRGTYEGQPAIAGAWVRFFSAQGPLMVDICDLQIMEEDGKQIVRARAVFTGKGKVPVDHTLVYDGGRLVSETWKIRQ